MGTPFERVRHLADRGSTFARFGVALLPVRECKDRGASYKFINIQHFLLAVQKNTRSEILHTARSSRARALYTLVYVALSELLV